MNNKKITAKMISRMSKQSLKSSRMRNIFVMITIVLASALLMAISMYAVGQQEDNQRKLSHAQEVGYYSLIELLACHFQKINNLITCATVEISCRFVS